MLFVICRETHAADLCDAIRSAEAVGIVTDDAAGYSRLEAAGEYRAFSLGYEAIIVREGDSVDSLISRDQSLPENPRKLLFETFNPGFSNKSLKSGDLLWLPTTTPYSGKFWNGFDPYSNKTWSDFSKN